MRFCVNSKDFFDEPQWIWPVIQCKQKLEARK